MPAQVITRSQFVTMLEKTKGATIIGLTVRGSSPARFKADRESLGKVSHFSVMLNARFDRAKAKALGVDVDSLPASKTPDWKEQIPKTPLSRHKTKGDKYIEALYLSGHTEYTRDGEPVDRSEIIDLIRTSKPVENAVPWRTPKVDNVVTARIQGVEYVVVDD